MLEFVKINEFYRSGFILEAFTKSVEGDIIACPSYPEACSHHIRNLSASYNVARRKIMFSCLGDPSAKVCSGNC